MHPQVGIRLLNQANGNEHTRASRMTSLQSLSALSGLRPYPIQNTISCVSPPLAPHQAYDLISRQHHLLRRTPRVPRTAARGMRALRGMLRGTRDVVALQESGVHAAKQQAGAAIQKVHVDAQPHDPTPRPTRPSRRSPKRLAVAADRPLRLELKGRWRIAPPCWSRNMVLPFGDMFHLPW